MSTGGLSLEEAVRALGAANERIGSLNTQLGMKDRDLDIAQKRVRQLESDLAYARTHRGEAVVPAAAAEKGGTTKGGQPDANLPKVVEQQRLDIRRISNERDVAKTERNAARNEARAAKDELVVVQRDLERARAEQGNLRAERDAAKAKLEDKESALANGDASVEALAAARADVERLTAEKAELQRRFDEIEKAFNDLSDGTTTASKSDGSGSVDVAARIGELEAELRKVQETLEGREDEIDKLTIQVGELAALRRQLEEARANVTRLEAELASAKAEPVQAQKSSDSQPLVDTTMVDALRAELEAARERATTNEGAAAELAVAKAEVERLNRELEALNKRFEETATRATTSAQKLVEMQDSYSSLHREKVSLEEALAAARADVERLQAEPGPTGSSGEQEEEAMTREVKPDQPVKSDGAGDTDPEQMIAEGMSQMIKRATAKATAEIVASMCQKCVVASCNYVAAPGQEVCSVDAFAAGGATRLVGFTRQDAIDALTTAGIPMPPMFGTESSSTERAEAPDHEGGGSDNGDPNQSTTYVFKGKTLECLRAAFKANKYSVFGSDEFAAYGWTTRSAMRQALSRFAFVTKKDGQFQFIRDKVPSEVTKK